MPSRPPAGARVQLVAYDGVESFLAAAQPTLERREAEHSLLLGSALALRAARRAPDAPPYFATVHDGAAGLVTAVAYMTPPFPLLVAPVRGGADEDGDADAEALELIARDLRERGHRPTGVLATPLLAERFVELWCRAAGVRARIKVRERLHVLTEVRPVPAPAGEMRLATARELDLVAGWIAAFEVEAVGDRAAAARSREAAERRIAEGQMHLWDDGGPRAMAAWSRPTPRGVSVNAVYTPPALRGRGYATALVAGLSRKLLAEGRAFCALFTDLANPTSNAIYARVGYRPLRDFTHYRFEHA
jgi:GNAT superfamily N-acetyltransferase